MKYTTSKTENVRGKVMHYLELSPYNGFNEHDILGTIRIGWLDKKHIFATGSTSPEFKNNLFALCLNSVRVTRGFHQCQFCDSQPYGPVIEQCSNEEVGLGSAEIRVFYNAKVYAAPNLIYHYVVKHGYCPPEEFIEAVLKGPHPKSEEYKNLVNLLPTTA